MVKIGSKLDNSSSEHSPAPPLSSDDSFPISASTLRQEFKDSLRQQVLNPDDIGVSLETFPYFLSDITKNALVASTCIHLKYKDEYRKYALGLPSLCPRILLSGPAGSEIYQEKLSKALAKHFGARILIVDSLSMPGGTPPKDDNSAKESLRPKHEASFASLIGTPIRTGDRVKFVGNFASTFQASFSSRGPSYGSEGSVLLPYPLIAVRFDESFPSGVNLSGLCENGHGFYCSAYNLLRVDDTDQLAVDEILEVASSLSKSGPLVLLVKHIDEVIIENWNCEILKSKFESLPPNVVMIGSHNDLYNHMEQDNFWSKDTPRAANQLTCLFPNEVTILPPQDEAMLSDWKQQLEQDLGSMRARLNAVSIQSVLNRFELQCPDLETLCINDQVLTIESFEKIIGWALSYQFMSEDSTENSNLMLSSQSIKNALNLLKGIQSKGKNLEKSSKFVVTENEFEKKLLADVIPPSDIGVTFDDIGGLENVKETLKELIMLPLQRPELFCKGQLTKPCKGILLFGPRGTGKTMLAKALASEAGANFIMFSKSSITSKHVGEGEKYFKAIFSLASKIAPSIIFFDVVDSMFGTSQSPSEHEFMRKMMFYWNDVCAKEKEQILVLAATDRPFDLDEAVIGWLPRRLMVNSPDALNREKILSVILAKEELAPDVDVQAIANMTNGYSGRDLKNLCTTAAYCPIREVLDKEKKERSSALAENRPLPALCSSADVRPLKMMDFEFAHQQVRTGVSLDTRSVTMLLKWNEIYGEGGSGSDTYLSYYM